MKHQYTKITPLPSTVPRQLALDMLHSHAEVIQLNPLVTGVKSIEAPRDAASDEFFSQWYEITEIITWGLGLKKKISFKGVFHDQPWGMQSHVYAPMGVDLRNKYRIGGNQPGEPREARELGIDTPVDGLYLREDVEITCSVALMSFVKKETKAATDTMIQRLTRKASLLDEGKLHAMFEDGKLKTSKPSASPTFGDAALPSPTFSAGPGSPGLPQDATFGAAGGVLPAPVDSKGFGHYHDVRRRQSQLQSRQSTYSTYSQPSNYHNQDHAQSGAESNGLPSVAEMPGSFYQPQNLQSSGMYPPPLKPYGQVFRSELPGDMVYSTPPPSQDQSAQPSPAQQPYQPHGTPQPSPRPDQASLGRAASTASSNYSQEGHKPPQLYVPPPQQRYSEPPPPPPQHPFPTPPMQQQQFMSTPPQPQHKHFSAPPPQQSYQPYGAPAPPSENGRQTSYPTPEPDHHRFSQMSIQSSIQSTPPTIRAQPASDLQGLPSQTRTRIVRCPVCKAFEGDEAAVTHHVTKEHFD